MAGAFEDVEEGAWPVHVMCDRFQCFRAFAYEVLQGLGEVEQQTVEEARAVHDWEDVLRGLLARDWDEYP